MSARIRRKMPSLNALRVFDAAARRLSFTEAADELCVTQGAVSQRIKALEAERGEPLFHRGKHGLALTPAGSRLASGIRDALERVEAAWNDDFEARPLRVSVLPSFASCWMVPRLPRFAEQHPAARVELLAHPGVIDLRRTGIDLAIRFGLGRYPDVASRRMMGDCVVPVCAPALLAQHETPRDPAELARMPILHDAPTESDGSGTDWATWLEEVGSPDVGLERGPRFSQADLALEAAARGLGVALARVSLASDHLATGRLVRLPLPAVPTAYSYHLVWRAEAGAETQVLRHWLLSEAAAQAGEAVLH